MLSAVFAAQGPEFDLGRVVFIIMLLVGGFIQWLANWLKKKQAEAKAMQQASSTEEDEAARERAWQRQIGSEDQPPAQPTARNPLEDLLKTLTELSAPEDRAREVEMPPVVVQPPPLPRAVPVGEPPKPHPVPAALPSVPAAAEQKRARHPLAVALGGVGDLRRAVVLREILGPPKALQTADDRLK